VGERLLCKQGVVGSIPTVSKPQDLVIGCGRMVEHALACSYLCGVVFGKQAIPALGESLGLVVVSRDL
jgi:hypothetical protein